MHDARGLAPDGWHVPTREEWGSLVKDLGGEPVAGKKMKNLNGWFNAAACTNEAYFNGLPGGAREMLREGMWSNNGFWWAGSEVDDKLAWVLKLSDNEDSAPIFKLPKGCGASVRCFKDN